VVVSVVVVLVAAGRNRRRNSAHGQEEGARVEIGEVVHHREMVGGIGLHWVEAGQGPTVVLLHGFPDFWYGWRLQIPALVEAGYRVVAPDLRGYNDSDRPPRRRDYTTELIAADVVGLIERTTGRGDVRAGGAGGESPGGRGTERGSGERVVGPGDDSGVVLVGHDWGGVVAWLVAAARPDLVRRLVVLNAPHPDGFRRTLRTSSQLLKSWYALFFQLPWLPERAMSAFGFALLTRVLEREVQNPSAFTGRDLDRYKEAWAKPGALRAALDYYRMAPRRMTVNRQSAPSRVSAPTLVLWGERDPHLDVKNLVGLDAYAPDLRVERFPDAGHWVQLDAAAGVNRLLIEAARPRG